jgi:hypothetical protein
MSVVVFVWPMGAKGPDGSPGVGHAAMHVSGEYGSIYVSLWPAAHSIFAGWSSPGKLHFVNGDRLADGRPAWASKPLTGLDERAIIQWWSQIQPNPLIDYQRKKGFQTTSDKDDAYEWAHNSRYRILSNQCSTVVVGALVAGASPKLRLEIRAWLYSHRISLGPVGLSIGLSALLRTIGTVSPTDVQRLVSAVWGDPR